MFLLGLSQAKTTTHPKKGTDQWNLPTHNCLPCPFSCTANPRPKRGTLAMRKVVSVFGTGSTTHFGRQRRDAGGSKCGSTLAPQRRITRRVTIEARMHKEFLSHTRAASV